MRPSVQLQSVLVRQPLRHIRTVTHLFFFLFNSIRRKNYVLPVATSPKKPIPNFWTFKNIGGFLFVLKMLVNNCLFVSSVALTAPGILTLASAPNF